MSGSLEDSGTSAGQLGPNRETADRQQGALRFSAHLALSLAAIGLVPPPHDMSAGVAYREMQARCTSWAGCDGHAAAVALCAAGYACLWGGASPELAEDTTQAL